MTPIVYLVVVIIGTFIGLILGSIVREKLDRKKINRINEDLREPEIEKLKEEIRYKFKDLDNYQNNNPLIRANYETRIFTIRYDISWNHFIGIDFDTDLSHIEDMVNKMKEKELYLKNNI